MTSLYNDSNGTVTELILPAVTDTLVGAATVDTFQNKTLVSGSVGNVILTDRLYSPSGPVTVSAGAPSAGQTLITTSGGIGGWSTVNNLGSSIYGRGTDADPNIGTGATMTLSRDMYYADLTIATGGTLRTNGYRVFVKGTTTLNGTGQINHNGNNASGRTAGGGRLSGTLGSSAAGGAGGTVNKGGSNGSTVSTNTMMGGPGGAGGDATGTGGRTGGNGGNGTSPTTANGGAQVWNDYTNAVRGVNAGGTKLNGGCGGGGGGATSLNVGGGGGGGAGVLVLISQTITGTGTISANGGAGADGAGTAGGGGGGGGGAIVLIYTNLSVNLANITASGGTGGTGGNVGSTGTAGQIFLINRT
jgi:hypothetical protein